jgi:hypothetical protein
MDNGQSHLWMHSDSYFGFWKMLMVLGWSIWVVEVKFDNVLSFRIEMSPQWCLSILKSVFKMIRMDKIESLQVMVTRLRMFVIQTSDRESVITIGMCDHRPKTSEWTVVESVRLFFWWWKLKPGLSDQHNSWLSSSDLLKMLKTVIYVIQCSADLSIVAGLPNVCHRHWYRSA